MTAARLALTVAALAALGPARAQDPGAGPLVAPVTPVPVAGAPGPMAVTASPLYLHAVYDPNGPSTLGSVSGVTAVREGSSALWVGFDYVRPFWTYRDFTLAVPPPYAAAFPALGDVGHTDNQFAFVPQVRYAYRPAGQDFDIGAAGSFLHTTGALRRTVATTGSAAGEVVASYDLALTSIVPIQAVRRDDAARLFGDSKATPVGIPVEMSAGVRSVVLSQDYTSAIHAAGTAGVNVATRMTHQAFQGLGATAAVSCDMPVAEDWAWFVGGRGSVLVGTNERSSNAAVVVAGLPGFADSLAESKTTLVPAAELEVGVAWGSELGCRLAHGDVPPVLSIRVAAVGQYWGGLGPLAAGSGQGFRPSDLFLGGVSVTVGLRR
jgi:hypothetical protein